ncbi:MAG: hypothetical protein PHS32_03340 [Rhodoferax sp.]|uniref:hypothetical protein n=1 Tax=Rhodoferax sp. TaxID=50421 RepID=UPI0026339AD2|nr:hypothetical protein [Rhodoferax sp.]MDD5332756.1 hypothetical protein [Rhodoferax sp.]
MQTSFCSSALSGLRWLLLLCAVAVGGAAMATVDPVATLRAKYTALEPQLRQNQFRQPLVLDSVETPNRLTGDIYAVVAHPFDAVSSGLNSPDHWCDVMLLHINSKYCRALVAPAGTTLHVHIGKKTPEALSIAPRFDFSYRLASLSPEYLDIVLKAKDGPLGTSDYLIELEAVALPNGKTFLHLTYSYAFNFAGRLALQTYLATLASAKVGFTVVGQLPDGQAEYIGGMRGLLERNTMRYYLAIDTYLDATSAAPPVQLEQRLQAWFTATERYPRQLHEIDRAAYLEMKRAEDLRQRTVQ